MGNRLTKIYTRTGDEGKTGLADGSRVSKDSPRITALGEVDELNSALGVLLAEPLPDGIRVMLTEIQQDLFDLGGEMAIPGSTLLDETRTECLEVALDELNEKLGPLKEFILPGGTRAAALAHLARAICRRTERCLVTLSKTENVTDAGKKYINRLSDFLFVLGRALNQAEGRSDVFWQKNRGR